jgi:hypothetical protein
MLMLARHRCCLLPASAQAENMLRVYTHEVEGHRWMGIIKESCGGKERAVVWHGSHHGSKFQVLLGSRQQVAVPFPKRFRGRGSLY